MPMTSKTDYTAVLKRLKSAIKHSGISARELADQTASLEPPEKIHHSSLGQTLNQKEGRRLSVSHALLISKLLAIPVIALFYDFTSEDEARRADTLVKRFTKLTPAAQDDVMKAASTRVPVAKKGA